MTCKGFYIVLIHLYFAMGFDDFIDKLIIVIMN